MRTDREDFILVHVAAARAGGGTKVL